jgi:hypothetical protein
VANWQFFALVDRCLYASVHSAGIRHDLGDPAFVMISLIVILAKVKAWGCGIGIRLLDDHTRRITDPLRATTEMHLWV